MDLCKCPYSTLYANTSFTIVKRHANYSLDLYKLFCSLYKTQDNSRDKNDNVDFILKIVNYSIKSNIYLFKTHFCINLNYTFFVC